MTDLFGGYRSQTTKALSSIQSDRYPDTNKDFEKNIQRLNEFVDYIASYLQTMQKGVDSANEDPITKLRQTVLDLGTLLGGGELLYGINLGDLRYFLPAIGAMFGFDSSQPFPINLFYAVEHFFLGYIIPLDAWAPAVNDVIQGWMDALGLNDDFRNAVQHLLTSFGNWTQELMDIFNNIVTLGGVFNIFDTTQSGPINNLWSQYYDLQSQFSIAHLGQVADPFLETLTPWIQAWANMVDVINDWLDIFATGFGDDGFARVNKWLTDLLVWVGDPVGLGSGELSTAGGVGSIPILGPVLNWLVGFDTGVPVLNQLIQAIGGTGSTLADLGDAFAAAQTDWNAMVSAFSSGNYSGGQAQFNEMISNLMRLFGSPDLLSEPYDPTFWGTKMLEQTLVPGGAVTSWTTLPNHHAAVLAPGVLTNLLPDGSFNKSSSLEANPIWTFDSTVDHTGTAGSGSARTAANGSIRDLEGISIQTSSGNQCTVSVFAKWTGVVASPGNAISLCVNAYDANGNQISDPYRVCATVINPGTTSIGYTGDSGNGATAADANGWVKLTGGYTAPANCVFFTTCLEVNSVVTVGNIWFDDAYMMMTLIDALHITNLFNIGMIPGDNVQSNTGIGVNQYFDDLMNKLSSAFNLNLLTGQTLNDAAAAAQQVAAIAGTAQDLSQTHSDVLSNAEAGLALQSSAIASFPLTSLPHDASGNLPLLSVPAGSSVTCFPSAGVSTAQGLAFIRFIALAPAAVTNVFVEIRKYDQATGIETKLWTSGDIGSLIPTGTIEGWVQVAISPTITGINPSDVLSFEIETLSNAIQVVGKQTNIPSLSGEKPSNVASSRTGLNTSNRSPTTLTRTLAQFNGNLPFVSAGLTGAVVITRHADETVAFTTFGGHTYNLPSWFRAGIDFLDVICCGAGGGGCEPYVNGGGNATSGSDSVCTIAGTTVRGLGGTHGTNPTVGIDGSGAGDFVFPASGAFQKVYHGGAGGYWNRNDFNTETMIVAGGAPGGAGAGGQQYNIRSQSGYPGQWAGYTFQPASLAAISCTVGLHGQGGRHGTIWAGDGGDGGIFFTARQNL